MTVAPPRLAVSVQRCGATHWATGETKRNGEATNARRLACRPIGRYTLYNFIVRDGGARDWMLTKRYSEVRATRLEMTGCMTRLEMSGCMRTSSRNNSERPSLLGGARPGAVEMTCRIRICFFAHR